MEIIINENNKDKFEEYKKLILHRDKLKKESIQYQEDYYRVFGKLILKLYKLKVKIITLKKQINYCQKQINLGHEILKNDLDTYIKNIMLDYKNELKDLTKYVKDVDKAKLIDDFKYRKIKKIYREMARLIHPDLNPECANNPVIFDLWNRLVNAYNCNDYDELCNLEVLIQSAIKNKNFKYDIQDIDTRINKIQQEIENIIKNNPYQYKFILIDEKEITCHKNEMENEILEYSKYQKELNKILKSFDIKDFIS